MTTRSATSGLCHKLIPLPDGRSPSDVVVERHDIVLLFDATNANPNGDPDAANMPRMQPHSLKGLVTDVCLKRKIRNFFSLYAPDGSLRSDSAPAGYDVFIRENAILQELMESAEVEATAKRIFLEEYGFTEADWTGKKQRSKPAPRGKAKDASAAVHESAARDSEDRRKQAYHDALCCTYFDVRYFGGVTGTEGPLKGSFYGQIRGPLQFTFAESLDRVLQLDMTITRCAVASEKQRRPGDAETTQEASNRTMGRKHVVSYGLYRTHIFFSPAFAVKTGFTYGDLDNFVFAVSNMYRDDAASARTGMRVVGLVDFAHTTSLGNEHAHKLFDLVKIRRTPDSLQRDYPASLDDYCGEAPLGAVRTLRNGKEVQTTVTAHQIIWDIPPGSSSS